MVEHKDRIPEKKRNKAAANLKQLLKFYSRFAKWAKPEFL